MRLRDQDQLGTLYTPDEHREWKEFKILFHDVGIHGVFDDLWEKRHDFFNHRRGASRKDLRRTDDDPCEEDPPFTNRQYLTKKGFRSHLTGDSAHGHPGTGQSGLSSSSSGNIPPSDTGEYAQSALMMLTFEKEAGMIEIVVAEFLLIPHGRAPPHQLMTYTFLLNRVLNLDNGKHTRSVLVVRSVP